MRNPTTEQETIRLFIHSYTAEWPRETMMDELWSETAYQEFKQQHPSSGLDWRKFHDRLQAELTREHGE